ncbi:Receptor-type guanylate cyclase gcy [Seminavis robusta]|uniref:Receptor-type guanylate cyclase gcy n=1 Tax=Seminavis robusta TaxID=568900 RepID=A0A9N8HLW4_9STRA|nr:Receptor-type guanylate cyclase gcy [Seminavis robusta]|eukprot:Sro707_g190530.1 Receptor-type guanylate cyclase gcy (792) ;mRNA; f:3022-6712
MCILPASDEVKEVHSDPKGAVDDAESPEPSSFQDECTKLDLDGAASVVMSEEDYGDNGVSAADEKGPALAAQETRLVNLSKLLVAFVITVLAFLIGIVTRSFLVSEEQSQHKEQFNAIADEIISITHIRSKSVFDNLESVGVSLTAQARAVNAQWPFVYFADFQVQGMISNQITGANTLTIHPLVQDQDREEWEQFSVDNQGWIEDAHGYDEHVHPVLYKRDFFNDTADDDGRLSSPGIGSLEINPSIWTIDDNGNTQDVTSSSSKVYSPFWQRAPAVDFSPSVNRDLQSVEMFEKVIEGMLETDHPVMTSVTDAAFLKEKYDRRFPAEEKEKPHIYLLSPIYDSLFVNRTAVGFLSALFRFDNFFVNILPDKEKGIIIVLDGSCGDTYSYLVSGHEAEFIGSGDHATHNRHMAREFHIAPFALLEETEDETYCQYSAKVYPSEEWSAKFFTNQPVQYAAAIVACFVVTSIVFILYDCLVQKRQAKVMDSATRTHAIVSSLYPSTVRDRLMEEVQAKEAKTKTRRKFEDDSASMSLAGSPCETSETIFGSKPIADLFPSTTIMFGDLVGFTSWSSERDPLQVFTLLETIYHSFDVVAKRRRIFKVETIGDCYVAVCGLPTPREDHAVAMARFSHECRNRMNLLVTQLEPVLGPGTSDLAMRIGLHSGPVTAGVLRGEKGRFQLFGDSVNTAARMESNGAKNKIHLSQETADLLIKGGKEKWVMAREEKIHAKGKGELQTYWLNVKASESEGSSITGDGTTERGSVVSSTEFAPPVNKPWVEVKLERDVESA